MAQEPLFYIPALGPEGFRYEPNFLSQKEEAFLLEKFKELSLKPYEFEGYEAKRRIKSYTKETGYPDFINSLLDRVAEFAGVLKDSIEHAMITEYSPGTPIGWHRDQPPYDKVIGISLGSPVPFRFRRENGKKWDRITITAEPRSIYIMTGPSRYVWQHSIPPVEDWRYSITMRTVK